MTVTATQTKATRKPTHRVYSVVGEGKNAKWVEIGAGWRNKDGKGCSAICHSFPINGHFVIRQATDKPASDEGQPE